MDLALLRFVLAGISSRSRLLPFARFTHRRRGKPEPERRNTRLSTTGLCRNLLFALPRVIIRSWCQQDALLDHLYSQLVRERLLGILHICLTLELCEPFDTPEVKLGPHKHTSAGINEAENRPKVSPIALLR